MNTKLGWKLLAVLTLSLAAQAARAVPPDPDRAFTDPNPVTDGAREALGDDQGFAPVDGAYADDPGHDWIVNHPVEIPGKLEEKAGPRPSTKEHWLPGNWEWQGYWTWQPGRWVLRPTPESRWADGDWKQIADDRWLWVRGHWHEEE